MAAVEDDFESWLSLKLKELQTDEGVFGSYIKGILDGDESIEDKTEALEGILTEITDADIPFHCQEILDKWKSSHLQVAAGNEGHLKSLENVEEKLVRLMETNAPSTTVHRNYTEEERRIREAILANYSQTSDNECDDDDIDDGGGGGGGGGEVKENGLFKNTNAAAVQQAEREKRERAKLDSQKKKEKDKEDREKQKKEQQERKEKRKTQKGERRR